METIKMELMCVECVGMAAAVGAAAYLGYLPPDPLMLALAVFDIGIVAKPVSNMIMEKIGVNRVL